MPSGFKVGVTDLDDLFKPRGSSAAGSNTGFLVGTQDLADRYRQSTGTHDRIGSNTGFFSGGVDLREKFRSIGYSFEVSGPTSLGVYEGGNLTMSVTPSGGVSPYTYQWQIENQSTYEWSDIPGQTAATLSIDPCSRTDDGNYRCVVTDAATDSVISFPAWATVYYAPTFSGSSSGGSASSGASLYLWVIASFGSPAPATFQWKRNGVAIDSSTDGGGKFSGYNTSELTFYCDYRDHNAEFTCTVTNGAALSATSSAIIWSVTYAPQITGQPGSWTACSGTSWPATLSCSATGNPSPSYQWQKWNGSSWDNVGTGSTLTIASPTPSDSGTYRCVVSNSEGSVNSSSGTITIYASPSITSGPSGLNVAAGTGPYALQCSATGDGTLYFEWQKWNGSSWQTYQSARPGNLGAASDQHVWNPIASGDAGDYRCLVTSEYGCTPAASGTATVVVT